LRNWDYDVIVASWPESLSPGNEQRDYCFGGMRWLSARKRSALSIPTRRQA
jgi:microcin C transport system substrate-binding protein